MVAPAGSIITLNQPYPPTSVTSRTTVAPKLARLVGGSRDVVHGHIGQPGRRHRRIGVRKHPPAGALAHVDHGIGAAIRHRLVDQLPVKEPGIKFLGPGKVLGLQFNVYKWVSHAAPPAIETGCPNRRGENKPPAPRCLSIVQNKNRAAGAGEPVTIVKLRLSSLFIALPHDSPCMTIWESDSLNGIKRLRI